ncbi:MAG: hypothetical protein EKK48_24390 [Candidatus Melainabacteria bacterium]|jgi:hypothetical protein|nr:MAG: hypothetical protein EKK48_24390 [Candidatus Melainabacteria bacterium]
MLVADNPSAEGGLEGSVQFADNGVRLFEDSTKAAQNSVIPGSSVDRALPSDFASGSVGADGSITFGSNQTAMDISSTTSPIQLMGEQISSMIKPFLAMPGGLGLVNAIFEFLTNLFTSFSSVAFDPKLWAQQAQASLDAMSKLKSSS